MVRHRIPIIVREWNKCKKVPKSDVADSFKGKLFDDLMTHFTLPELESQIEMDKQKALVKKWALQKMGELFRAWKKRLWATYKEENKPPKLKGYISKQEHNWDAFVKYKTSEDAEALLKKNKKNASEKEYHHHTGRGCYQKAMPKWDEQEAEMQRNGITPEPIRENWDLRARYWFLAHGCEHDVRTRNLVQSDKVKIPRER
jgi:phage/plasmid-associated DNA primase